MLLLRRCLQRFEQTRTRSSSGTRSASTSALSPRPTLALCSIAPVNFDPPAKETAVGDEATELGVEFIQDVRLIWANCCVYNADGAVISKWSRQLARFFSKAYLEEFRVKKLPKVVDLEARSAAAPPQVPKKRKRAPRGPRASRAKGAANGKRASGKRASGKRASGSRRSTPPTTKPAHYGEAVDGSAVAAALDAEQHHAHQQCDSCTHPYA